jgi:hypothetical protein
MYPLDEHHRLPPMRPRQGPRRELFREFRKRIPPSEGHEESKSFRSAKLSIPVDSHDEGMEETGTQTVFPPEPPKTPRFAFSHTVVLSLPNEEPPLQELLAPNSF